MTKRAIAVILGVGFAYRLLFIAKSQLRTDELMQALVVRADSAAAMLDRLRGGLLLPTPLDPLIQKGVVALLGESGWALRLHAAMFGALSIWFFFRVARFLFGERVALYSSALFAVYPLHQHYSQEALPYALSTLLTLVSFDLLLRLFSRAYRGWQWWAAWAAAEALLLYSSVAGTAILFSQCCALFLSCRWKVGNVAGPGDSEAGIPVPQEPGADLSVKIAFVGWAALACAAFWPWARIDWAAHAVAHPEILSFKLLLRILKELGDGSYPISGLLIGGIATGTVALLRHGGARPVGWLATWFALPPVVIYVLDRWAGSSLMIGQLLPSTPPLLLLAGYGMSHVGERLTILDRLPPRPSSPALVYAAALAIGSVIVAHGHWRSVSTDWRGTAQYLQETLRAGDRLEVPAGLPLLEYYSPRLSEFSSMERITFLPESVARAGRSFVVCLGSLRPDPCSSIRAEAKKRGFWKVHLEFAGLTVFAQE